MKTLKPSDFKNVNAMSSVTQKSEAETVAMNIIKILSRTGDEWRELTFVEYKEERLKDGEWYWMEEKYFNQVNGYCVSIDTAKLFCPSWRALVEGNNVKPQKK